MTSMSASQFITAATEAGIDAWLDYSWRGTCSVRVPCGYLPAGRPWSFCDQNGELGDSPLAPGQAREDAPLPGSMSLFVHEADHAPGARTLVAVAGNVTPERALTALAQAARENWTAFTAPDGGARPSPTPDLLCLEPGCPRLPEPGRVLCGPCQRASAGRDPLCDRPHRPLPGDRDSGKCEVCGDYMENRIHVHRAR